MPKKWYVGYAQEYDIDAGDDGRTIGYPTGGSEFDGTVFEVNVDGDQVETVAEQIRDEKTAHLIAAAPDMKEALEWYAEKVLNCRKITAEGDEARHDLDHDGGKRARMALEKARDEV